MTIRPLVFFASSLASALILSLPAAAQSDGGSAPLHTTDGQPDISGVWDFRTVTPLERPEEFADQEFLTEEEVAAYAALRRWPLQGNHEHSDFRRRFTAGPNPR